LKNPQEHQGGVLRGDIDFEKLKEDKMYAKAVGEKMLTDERIKNKVMNYSGYVGFIENYQKHVHEDVEERLEALEKFIPIKPEGYSEVMYIVQVQNDELDSHSNYVLLTRDEVDKYKSEPDKSNIGTHIFGEIDISRLEREKNYKAYAEAYFLNKNRIDAKLKEFDGYVGEIIDSSKESKFKDFGRNRNTVMGFYNYNDPDVQEYFAHTGVNGEIKIKSEVANDFYVKECGSVGEKDYNGNEIYQYEIIYEDDMKKLRSGASKHYSSEEQRLYITSAKEDLKYLKNYSISGLIMDGGCVSESAYRARCVNRTCSIDLDNSFGLKGRFFEQNGHNYFVPYDTSLSDRDFKDRVCLEGDIDIERMNKDERYRRFIEKKVFTVENYKALFIDKKIKGFDISEEDEKLAYKVIENEKQMSRGLIERS